MVARTRNLNHSIIKSFNLPMCRIQNRVSMVVLVLLCRFSVMAATGSDSIIIVKDHRLDVLTAKQVQINKRTAMMTSSGMYKGYRIQVISTNKRDLAFKTKSELLARFPDQKSYTMYQSPYFKVRIGNFIKKEDAEKFRKQLMKYYPQGVYVVEDAIEYAPRDEEELISQ